MVYNEKPYFQMDDLGVKTHIFGENHPCVDVSILCFSSESLNLIDGLHFLPDDFKFFLMLLAELCMRKKSRTPNGKLNKLTSRFSWVFRFEISNIFDWLVVDSPPI